MHLITLNATDHPQPPVIDRVLLIDESPDPRARDLGKRRGRGRHRQRGPDLIRLLADRGCDVTLAPDAAAALEESGRRAFLFIIIQTRCQEGLTILRGLRERSPTARVVVVTDRPGLKSAVEALRLGAFDYLQEPVCPESIEAVIRRARQSGDPGQRELLRSLRILAPGMVHELRNPLSGILGGSQMLAGLVAANQSARDYVEILQDEARQLEGFLARLAQFGRLQAGNLALNGGLDLHSLLDRMLDEVRPTCTARGIRQSICFDRQASGIHADPAQLSRACTEILHNALEAMPTGGTLSVMTRRGAGVGAPGSGVGVSGSEWVAVEFADTGVGMTDEVRRRAFEPFFSTRPRALGIGLPLAEAILQAHGGCIRLHSRPGEGTQVHLSLPGAIP